MDEPQIAPDDDDNGADQTAIEEASVIRLLRVVMAGAAPPTAAAHEDRMQHDAQDGDQSTTAEDMTPEEAGCLLWDMSASRAVARVMVRNHALEALEIVIGRELVIAHGSELLISAVQAAEESGLPADATPAVRDATAASPSADPSPLRDGAKQLERQQTQKAMRILEICLGTLANLVVTQPAAAAAASSRTDLLALLFAPPMPSEAAEDEDAGNGLHAGAGAGRSGGVGEGGRAGGDAVTGASGGVLFVDDARVLSELFRLCSFALRCQGASSWLTVLSSPALLRRVMWVAAATADAQVFARCLDMLVALLHAATAATAVTAAEQPKAAAAAEAPEGPHPSTTGAVPAPTPAPAAATATAAGAASICRRLLQCGLLELVHSVLRQALMACLPAEEKYGAFASLCDPQDYGVGAVAGAEEPSSEAVGMLRGGSPSVGTSAVASTTPPDRATGSETPEVAGGPGPCGDRAGAGLAAAAAPALPHAASTAVRAVADTGSRGEGAGPPEAAVAEGGGVAGRRAPAGDEDGGAAEAEAAAAVVAAVVATPVPLSDEAVDAVLRLVEELVAPNGPLASETGSDVAAAAAAPSGVGTSAGECDTSGATSPVEELLRLASCRQLRPGLLQLLLGLLRYQYDSMQVLEGLLVVLVDLGAAVQHEVAASQPTDAAAIAARLVEALQDCGYSNTNGGASSAVQLQQGAWYLLAATMRGVLAAATAAADAASAAVPGSTAATSPILGPDKGPAATGVTGADVAAVVRSWWAAWASLSRTLLALSELPRAEGCEGYARACGLAGKQLRELVRLLPPLGDADGNGVGEGSRRRRALGEEAEAVGGEEEEKQGVVSEDRLATVLEELVGCSGDAGAE